MRKPKQARAAASKGAAVSAKFAKGKEPKISFGRTGYIDYGVDGSSKKPRKPK